MSRESYERQQFEKLMTVVRAGQQNPICRQELEIKTQGYDPSAHIYIDAELLAKWLRLPK